MSDTQTAATKRPTVADRQWIDQSGKEVPNDEKPSATGFKYVDLASGNAYSYQLTDDTPRHVLVTLAIFGGLTKAGNIRNTLVNSDKGDPDADVIPAIKGWFDLLEQDGKWGEDREGLGRARFDLDKLALAIATAKGEEHDESAVAGYRAKMGSKVSDPGRPKVQIFYETNAHRHPEVRKHYERMVPPKTVTVPELGNL